MIPCLSPNGQTYFDLDGSPLGLLVGSASGVVLLRREGRDQPWREAGRSLEGKHIGALALAPGGLVFAGCHLSGGVYRSADGGNSWQEVAQSIEATDVFSLATIETHEGWSILAGTEPVNLYRSDDAGDTWKELPAITRLPGAEFWTFPPPPHVPHLKSMAVVSGKSGCVYGCVEQGALVRSEDGGLTWSELAGMWRPEDMAYRDAHRVVALPWNTDHLFFNSGLGVYRSEDRGATWSRCSGVAEYTKYPDVLVVSCSDEAIFVGGPKDYPVDWIGGSPGGTVCRSLDSGLTWQAAHGGLIADHIANIEGLSLVAYPGGYTLFAGDTEGRIFASEDRGDSWQQIGQAGPISKGGHYHLAQMSQKLPGWAGAFATLAATKILGFSQRRAGAKRLAQFRKRAGLEET